MQKAVKGPVAVMIEGSDLVEAYVQSVFAKSRFEMRSLGDILTAAMVLFLASHAFGVTSLPYKLLVVATTLLLVVIAVRYVALEMFVARQEKNALRDLNEVIARELR